MKGIPGQVQGELGGVGRQLLVPLGAPRNPLKSKCFVSGYHSGLVGEVYVAPRRQATQTTCEYAGTGAGHAAIDDPALRLWK